MDRLEVRKYGPYGGPTEITAGTRVVDRARVASLRDDADAAGVDLPGSSERTLQAERLTNLAGKLLYPFVSLK